jgi:nicotinate-nucleotide pyrophosphorylase (carboxylating)
MLRGERTALNFLMRMCGIATAARSAVTETAETGARILDTRKTAPGLRRLDKYAVAAGGALNHRLGLYDAVMIKDTHLGVVGSVAGAVARARAAGHPADRITVEVRDVEQLRQAIESGAGRALLDNMDPVALREAVKIGGGRIVLEASGGLRPGALRAIAESGVDYLSIGYLTHSAPAADLAMEMEMSS